MKKSVMAGAAALALAALIWMPVDRAQAQDAADQSATSAGGAAATDQSAQAGAAGGQLQEVVVTAERRATNLQTTPVAVTALSGDTLQAVHLESVIDLQTTVPDFFAQDQGPEQSINMRGLGNAVGGANVASGVATLRDGILMATRLAQNEPMYDEADVEVLQGPQGTFVGASSDAGAVEINSANPNFNGVNGYVLGKLGTYSDVQTQGAINLPVTDTFAARLAFNYEQRGSFTKDIGADDAGYYVNTAGAIEPLNQGATGPSSPLIDPGSLAVNQARVKLLWKPTDNFQWLSTVEYWSENDGGYDFEPNTYTYQTLFTAGAESNATGVQAGCTLGGPLNAKQEICATPGSQTHSTYYYPGEEPFLRDYYGLDAELENTMSRFGEELRYTLPDGIELRSLSAYVHLAVNDDEDISSGPQNAGYEAQEIGPNVRYLSEELNVISPTTGKVNWIAGGYWNYRDTPDYMTENEVSSPYQPGALPSTLILIQGGSVNRTMALFGQLNWQFTHTLQLQVGARENWDSNFAATIMGVSSPPGTILTEPNGSGVYSMSYAGGSTTPTSYRVLAQDRPLGQFTDTVPTGKIDLNWTPLPGQNFYLFYARGYKAGGVNAGDSGISTDHPVFNPEYVNDWEAGWKGSLLDGHMLTQVGGFYYDLQNFQYSLFDTEQENDSATGTYDANLAPSTIEGIEVSEQSRFGGLGVNIALSYLHSALGSTTTVNNAALPAGFGSNPATPQCVVGHTYADACFNYTPYLQNVSGEQLPYAPEYTANISVDYLFHVGAGTLDPRVWFSYADQQYASIFEDQFNLMQARHLLNVSIDWVVGKWDMQLYGTNVTNQDYLLTSGTTFLYGPPRQGGFQATYRF